MKFGKLLVALGVAVLMTSAMAQPGGGGRGQGRGGMRMMGGMQSSAFLLQRPDVQADLKLTDDQKTKLSGLRDEMMETFRSSFQDLRDASPEERQKAMQKVNEEMDKKINGVLNADQQKRLKEIGIQLGGLRVVTTPEMQKALGITEDQKTKIQALLAKQAEANASIREKMQSGEIDRTEIGALMEKNQKALDDEIGKVLTTEQKDKLKAMSGKPFVRQEGGRGGG